ncbi:MAG TPA: hypothetical protein VNA17_10615 [Pyrinomonadaceae bacterium]|nr:hypothetical protein [Pyrinomonadaceae bacterium]
MPTKYDTNPLDPDFPERIKAEAEAEMATRALPFRGAETCDVSGAMPSEEQTRRFVPNDIPAYQSPFNGQNVPAYYQAAQIDRSSERKVEKVGLPENVLTAVPYIPWYLGLVAGIILLVLLPKSETKVRFHAAQGLAAHIGILIVTTILSIIGGITDIAEIGQFFFQLVTSIMLVIFALKAWRGKPVHIESVDGLTNWLEDKIGPVKSL